MLTTTSAGGSGGQDSPTGSSSKAAPAKAVASAEDRDAGTFRFETERFGELAMLRYRVPGFEALDRKSKTLLYYLYEAALCGREIIFDQKYRYNLGVKRTLEEVF